MWKVCFFLLVCLATLAKGETRRQPTEYRALGQELVDSEESSGMSSGEDPTWDDLEEQASNVNANGLFSDDEDEFSGSGSGSGGAEADWDEDTGPDSIEEEEEVQVDEANQQNTIPNDDDNKRDEAESTNDLGENYDEAEPNAIGTRKKTPPITSDVDNKVDTYVMAQKKGSHNPFESTEVLAAVIAGGVAGLVLAVLLIVFIVHRMRKKDQGSYMLGRPAAQPYQRASDQEIYA